MNKEKKSIIDFLKAKIEAESKWNHNFTCPVCGGEAYWEKTNDGKVFSGCAKCGILIFE